VYRGNIQEGQNPVGFQETFGRGLSGGNLTEDASLSHSVSFWCGFQ
jgi:hypothetical protein